MISESVPANSFSVLNHYQGTEICADWKFDLVEYEPAALTEFRNMVGGVLFIAYNKIVF